MKTGDIVSIDDRRFRIISVDDDYVIVIALDIDRYDIRVFTTHEFRRMISSEEISRFSSAKNEPMHESNPDVLVAWESFEAILQKIYPRWDLLQTKSSIPELEQMYKKPGFRKTSFHRKMRRYLQSGRKPEALKDKRCISKEDRNDK